MLAPTIAQVTEFPRPLGLVLSGGGAIGSVQVGHLLALHDLGIVPDVIVGTSVGAINGAVVAADPVLGAVRLASIWSKLRRDDVFPIRPLGLLNSLRNGAAGVLTTSGLVSLVSRHLPVQNMDDLAIPLHAIAADAVTGTLVDLCSGDLVQALMASSALPGIFPPVHLAGRTLMDGGLVADLPVDHAFDLGVRSVIVLDSSGPCEITDPPRTIVESVATALRILTRNQADADVHAAAGRGLLVHLPTPCTIRHSVLDFRGVADLIPLTRRMTQEFFAQRAGEPWPARGMVGRLHRHTDGHVCTIAA